MNRWRIEFPSKNFNKNINILKSELEMGYIKDSSVLFENMKTKLVNDINQCRRDGKILYTVHSSIKILLGTLKLQWMHI